MAKNILEQLRLSKNMTQKELAKAIGKSKSSIYAYENGEREMSAPILIEIADFFEVSIDELLRHTPKSTITTQNASIHLEKIKKNLATLTKEVDSFSQTIKNKKWFYIYNMKYSWAIVSFFVKKVKMIIVKYCCLTNFMLYYNDLVLDTY